MEMTEIKIGGVPEHFNLPWQLAMEDHAFAKANIALHWQEVPEGTGRMCQMLRDGELDVACILTDGLVKDILQGNPARIIQGYVKSPLMWGVHTGAESSLEMLSDADHRSFAISRMGSGSHIMSYVLAEREGWEEESIAHHVVNNLSTAVKELNADEGAEIFLWEKTMTQPLIDQGRLRRLDTISCPWPSFVIAATPQAMSEKAAALQGMLKVINNYTLEFRHIPKIATTLAAHYDLPLTSVKEWLGDVRFSQQQVNEEEIAVILETLKLAGMIKEVEVDQSFVADLNKD